MTLGGKERKSKGPRCWVENSPSDHITNLHFYDLGLVQSSLGLRGSTYVNPFHEWKRPGTQEVDISSPTVKDEVF